MAQTNKFLANDATVAEYRAKYNYAESQPIKWQIKRVIDVTHATAGLLLCSPILVGAAIAIKAESTGPVIFKQQRIGLDGKMFTIYKLRTMYNNTQYKQVMSQDDQDITQIGKILRKYSIDEIPQLFNVLRNDMSLVGPRPLTEQSFQIRNAKYTDYGIRHIVKPGLCLGANRLGTDKNIAEIEKSYIQNWSLGGDLRVFLEIIRHVLHGRNF